uniref:Uncharacterized protein n=1 Tax=Leptobrachium leishanense TaxID=445787 RepID=A0A8C5MQK8_9ANUR
MALDLMRQELTCSICLNVYRDPTTLPCGHSFCRTCSTRTFENQLEREYFCPECLRKFKEKPRVHTKSEEHVLTEPTTSLENRKCSVHKKVLEYYCCKDSACICVYCLVGEHRGHQVETLKEASEKRKETLRNILQKLTSQKDEAEKRVQSLEEHRRQVQEKAAGVSELEELSRKMGDIEELCDTTDPLTVLQGRDSDRSDYCDAMEVENEDVIRVHDTGDLDVGQISETLYTGLAVIASQIRSQLDVTDDPGMFLELSRSSHLFPDIAIDGNTSSDMFLGVDLGLGMVLDVNYALDLFLDVNTAGNKVSVSPDLKTASCSGINQSRPETPERFQYPQVLSSRSFSSGRHYWEVETSRSGDWMVGVAYPSIERKGNLSYIGSNDKSWALWRWDDNQYYIKHNSRVIPLSRAPSSPHIGIYLDYEAGQLLFYEICEDNRQFHNIKTTFTEPLHVAVWLGRHSLCSVGIRPPLMFPVAPLELATLIVHLFL